MDIYFSCSVNDFDCKIKKVKNRMESSVILIGAINNNNQDSAKVGTAQVHTIVSVTDNMG